MKYYSVLGNSQALDGGAMFGHVPKLMWEKWTPVDHENRVHLVTRGLLVKHQNKKILFEAGIGTFFAPKFKSRYGVYPEEHVLLRSLADLGESHESIDIVVLSHLHFDHVGGLLAGYEISDSGTAKPYRLLFPNAKFMVSESAYLRNIKPLLRDRASFIPEIPALLKQTNRLVLIPDHQTTHELLGPNFHFWWSHGHTPGMLCTEIKNPDPSVPPVVFSADLIPGRLWMSLSFAMGYDGCAETILAEKEKLLEYLVTRKGQLFFTHDPDYSVGTVHRDPERSGQYIIQDLKILI
jgi:glyoxylase-like metal-dependent hydrolase (beta-lactamase superfamily II)